MVIHFRNQLVCSAKSRSCVDFVEIVCRFHPECSSLDRVSISPRSCVDFTRCSLEFGSDLKNLHRGGECREREKKQNIEFLKLYDRTSVDRAIDRRAQGLDRSIARSTDVARERGTQLGPVD